MAQPIGACPRYGNRSVLARADARALSITLLQAEASEAGASVHPQAVERALWACGTLQHNPGAEVLAQSATAAAAVARAAAPSALAHTLWALAALRTPPPPGAAADLAAAAAAKFAAATPGELVTIFWAMASLGRDPGSPWYEAFEAAAAQHGGELDAGSRATILWSYATIRRHPGAAALAGHANAWLAALESSGNEAASDTAAAALEKAMWACASLRYVPGGPWIARVARVALPRLSRFDANGLATLLWSFASMGASPGAELLARAADVWMARLPEASPPPQAVANTLWAFATLSYHPGEPWLDAVAAATRGRLLEFPAAALASCVWAYGSLAHAPAGGWLPAAAEAVARRLPDLDAETLSQAVWGFATLSFHPGRPWLDAFGRAATAALGPDQPPASVVALTNMLFGLMVLREHAAAAGGPTRSATGVAWAALAAAADAGAVGEAALRILMTADLLLDSEAPELAGALPPPAGGAAGGTTRALWRQRARMAWADSVRAAAAAQAATHHQRDVCRALTALKLQHTPGLLVERDGLPVIAIDAALTCRGGGRAALQADGASAFVRNSKQPTGSSLLRDRLFETLGWRVVVLPGHAWPRATESRTAYLEKVLRDVKGIL
jgi:hypothetical protein